MLTEGEKLRAQRLLGGHGLSFNAVSRKLGIPADTLRRELKAPKPRGRHAYHDFHKAVLNDGQPIGMVAAGLSQPGHSAVAPPDRLAERERAMSAPRSLTAELMGDPPFERSALAKRRLRLVVSR